MSAVEVTISGILYDRSARTQQSVVLIGEATLTGLGVGGGPIIPPVGGSPPGIWGPTDPRPGWGLPGGEPHPEHPWVPPSAPDKPTEPPPEGGDKPPPDDGGWGFVAEWSKWGYFPGEEEPAPKTAGRRRR